MVNCHRFYPLTELNWIIYTTDGNTRPIGSEGRDLINFGGQAQGNGMLTWAIGARYKISESAQIGGAFEFPSPARATSSATASRSTSSCGTSAAAAAELVVATSPDVTAQESQQQRVGKIPNRGIFFVVCRNSSISKSLLRSGRN